MTATTSASLTPADLEIRKRDWQFGRETPNPRWWLNDNPGATAFYNALSSTFPLGERFFMDSVKFYRERVPEPLQKQIGAFLYQEAMHSREHVVFNQQAEAAGYDVSPLEERTRKELAIARKLPPLVQLAATAALEHFTAQLAHALLSDPRHLEGATPEAQKMWRWHAMEELEHKAVAYDTYLHVTRNWSGLNRWLVRSLVMFGAMIDLHVNLALDTGTLMAQDKRNTLGAWFKLLGYLYGKPGIMRTLILGSFSYYKPGFHPWQDDDRNLLAETERSFAPA